MQWYIIFDQVYIPIGIDSKSMFSVLNAIKRWWCIDLVQPGTKTFDHFTLVPSWISRWRIDGFFINVCWGFNIMNVWFMHCKPINTGLSGSSISKLSSNIIWIFNVAHYLINGKSLKLNMVYYSFAYWKSLHRERNHISYSHYPSGTD